jgi:hypothetical protein
MLQTLLTRLPRDQHPLDWARAQQTLATTYLRRLKGDLEENAHLAREACMRSLEAATRETSPKLWANAKSTLGFALYCSETGDDFARFTEAIAQCREAIEVYDAAKFPEQRATTLHYLKRETMSAPRIRRAATSHPLKHVVAPHEQVGAEKQRQSRVNHKAQRGASFSANPASFYMGWLHGGATRAEYRDIVEVREAVCRGIASSSSPDQDVGARGRRLSWGLNFATWFH